MSIRLPEDINPYSANPITQNTLAIDLVLSSLLGALELKHPGIKAEVKEILESLITRLDASNPSAAEMRKEMFDIARSIVE